MSHKNPVTVRRKLSRKINTNVL